MIDHDRGSRLALARIPYEEVLDATKHQDDKIGRFLAAIAFLASAGIALALKESTLQTSWQFGDPSSGAAGHGGWRILAGVLSVFFCLILAAVALLLVSLGAPLRVPGRTSRYLPQLKNSRLFFTHIADVPIDDWKKRWAPSVSTEDISREIASNYITEAHNLAERATLKYRLTREASSLFGLALTFLAIGACLSTLGMVSGTPNTAAHFTWPTALSCAMIIGGFCWIQIHAAAGDQMLSARLRRDAESNIPEAEPPWKSAQSLLKIRWFPGIFALELLLAGISHKGQLLAFIATILTVPFFIWSSYSRWWSASKKKNAERIVQFFVIPPTIALIAICFGGIFPFTVALCVPVAVAWAVNTRRLPSWTTPKAPAGPVSVP